MNIYEYIHICIYSYIYGYMHVYMCILHNGNQKKKRPRIREEVVGDTWGSWKK